MRDETESDAHAVQVLTTGKILLIGVLIGFFFSGLLLFYLTYPKEKTLALLPRPTTGPLVAEISGAVNRPGVYEFHHGITVDELVSVAGGFTADADPDNSHRAARVSDGDHIVIPTIGSPEPTVTLFVGMQSSGKINVNTATAPELMTLPGIGERKAQDIIAYREANGPFKDVSDLLNVNGLGEKTVENFADRIILE